MMCGVQAMEQEEAAAPPTNPQPAHPHAEQPTASSVTALHQAERRERLSRCRPKHVLGSAAATARVHSLQLLAPALCTAQVRLVHSLRAHTTVAPRLHPGGGGVRRVCGDGVSTRSRQAAEARATAWAGA
jgi:hypothetical protein